MTTKKVRAAPDRRTVWHSVEIPRRVKVARRRCKPRHLADLLCAIGVSYWTARHWAKWPENFPEWLPACEGVPRPYRHELDALRYVDKGNVAAVQTMMCELVADGRTDADALHAAVDEVIGAARIAGEARRNARRIAKYGHDPVPEKRLSREERAAVKPKRAEYAQRALDRNTKKRKGLNRKQRRAKRPWHGVKGGVKAYAKAIFEQKRRARMDAAMVQIFGVPLSEWPKKSAKQQASERLELKREERRQTRGNGAVRVVVKHFT